MNLGIINFTLKGGILNQKINDKLSESGHLCTSYTISKFAEELGFLEIGASLNKWTKIMFAEKDGIIFIGACGIAVRAIAPFVKDKKTDPAIIVMDEKGEFVIPILAGHIGGANSLANEVSVITGGKAVITTATDVNGKFAVDTFATKKNLHINDINIVKEISSAILEEKEIGIFSDYEIKNQLPDGLKILSSGELGICISLEKKKPFKGTLNLIPKILTIGIGCRKDISIDKIEALVKNVLEENNLSIYGVKKAASIDLKKNEQGILRFCEKYNIPFEVYSSEELKNLDGDYTESEFVSKITGVSNVCERAAVMGSNKGKLIIKKTAENGVAVAIAVEDWSVEF